jgi:hypothetical protein
MPPLFCRRLGCGFLKIFNRKQQHAKAFAVVFIKVLVVHFVGAAHGYAITAGSIAKYLKALVYKNIVHHKVGKAVGKNTQAYGKAYLQNIILPQQEKPNAYNGIKYKKGIVALKPAVMVFAVVVFVQAP